VQKLLRREAPLRGAAFWVPNVVAALLYGLAYLPAAASVAPLTAFGVVSIVSVKAVAGVVFGELFRRRGLEVVMLAHFVADILIHVIGPVFAK
jgi:membrane protease YdiL (CAAX protease family)